MSPAAPDAEDFRQFRDEVLSAIRDLRQSLETGYQRKDVADREMQLLGIQITGIEGEVHTLTKRVDSWETRAEKARSARWSIFASSLLGPILVVICLRAMGLVGAG